MKGDNGEAIYTTLALLAVDAYLQRFPERITGFIRIGVNSFPLDKWAYDNQVTLDFSRPGKPTTIHSSNLSTAAFAMSA